MAGKHDGVTLTTVGGTSRPEYPGNRNDKAFAEGRNGGTNPHTYGTPIYQAYQNGIESADSEQRQTADTTNKSPVFTFAADSVISVTGIQPSSVVAGRIQMLVTPTAVPATGTAYMANAGTFYIAQSSTNTKANGQWWFIGNGAAGLAAATESKIIMNWTGTEAADQGSISVDGGTASTAEVQAGSGTTLTIGHASTGFLGIIREVKIWIGSEGVGEPERYYRINEQSNTIIDYGTDGTNATLTPGSGAWSSS